jgi:hypothetical protein
MGVGLCLVVIGAMIGWVARRVFTEYRDEREEDEA